MKILDWISCKIKEKHNENKIYLISNYEINKQDHDLYVKIAQKRSSEEDLNIDIVYGRKHRNEIRTAKYKVYSFIPLVIFFQFLRLGNLYYLTISILQLIPEITDSKGMPTYLIPLTFIIVVAMIKEFFEDWQRHKSDNEEDSKKTMVFVNGVSQEKKWADIQDGDVVKIFSYEYFPADLIVLNCSNKKGIVNIETKNVDGESNVKQKYCFPNIAQYFSDDTHAGFCRIELISERSNDNIFDYNGYMLLPPIQYKREDGEIVHIDSNELNTDLRKKKIIKNILISDKKIKDINSENEGMVVMNDDYPKKHILHNMSKFFKKCIYIKQESDVSHVNMSITEKKTSEMKKELDANIDSRVIRSGTGVNSVNENKSNTVHLTIDNLVLRGTSLVNTKWIYGLVINTGNRTKLMKNVSTKSRHKWSRLEFVYGNHVIILIIFQIFISFIVAIAGVLWMRKKGYDSWYLHLDKTSDSLKTFFITIGSMILLFGSFIPVDLLLIWEIVRLLQGYLINWDKDMYSKKTDRYALSKAGQLLEEMGNVTHIYSDKTGTLTQNVMQLQNIGLGSNGIYGFYDFDNIKDNIGISRRFNAKESIDFFIESENNKERYSDKGSCQKKLMKNSSIPESFNWAKNSLNPLSVKINSFLVNILENENESTAYTKDDFFREGNEFVFFNRFLFANKIHKIQNEVKDQIYFLLLVLGLCHSVMIRNAGIDDMDIDDTNNSNKIKIYDNETNLKYTYMTQTQPQYDASSPDELALVSTSLYLGFEFVKRPNLTTIEIELTSVFAQRFILGDELFQKFLLKKKYYEENFNSFFPEESVQQKEKKNDPKINGNNTKNNVTEVKDDSNLYLSIPIKNLFPGINKASCKESTNTNENLIKNVVPVLSFKILDVFSFDNVRKRMSLIIKNEKNEIYMLVKGADSNVLQMASKNQQIMIEQIEYQLNTFATSGLRTLVLGYKRLTEDEFNVMYQNHIELRKKTDKENEEYLKNFYDQAEKDLIIVGCTGIDDKLQDDVPQVIQDLRDAGINICVLTGDKLETAISIGHSINILNKNTYNSVFTSTDTDVLFEQINTHEKNTNAANLLNVEYDTKWWDSINWEKLNLDLRSETLINFVKNNFSDPLKKKCSYNPFNMKDNNSIPSLVKQEKVFNSFLESSESFSHDLDRSKANEVIRYSQFSITITGEALDVIMKNKILKIKFYTLVRNTSTLIACRVTPKQKSLLVKEISAFNPRSTSLAIGDGANDVGMILMANVGVGIAGKEGLQASRSSDFTISEFKYLKKLLFVHGRESLRRNSFLVYFCIFRNVSFCLCSMVLIFWSGYSAVDAWNPWTKQIINIAFTSLPVILFVALDKQLPHNILLNNPLLYETSPSTLWPFYPNRKIEFYTKKVKNICTFFFKICFIPFKFIPYIRKSTNKIKFWIGKRSKPEKYRSYGTHYLFVYLLFAIWLALVETILLLYFSTGQNGYKFEENHNIDIDFHSFSQILYTHHVIAVNAVVVFMTNTWFLISYLVFSLEFIFVFIFWFILSKEKLFLDIVGADDLHGTFEKAHYSANYYFSLVISLYISILPLLLLMTYQFIKKPTMEQIVLEQINLGKFEGLRKHEKRKLAYIDNKNSSKYIVHKGFAFATEAKEAFWGIVQKAIYKIKIPLLIDETLLDKQND